jgi:hypothetical protein
MKDLKKLNGVSQEDLAGFSEDTLKQMEMEQVEGGLINRCSNNCWFGCKGTSESITTAQTQTVAKA